MRKLTSRTPFARNDSGSVATSECSVHAGSIVPTGFGKSTRTGRLSASTNVSFPPVKSAAGCDASSSTVRIE